MNRNEIKEIINEILNEPDNELIIKITGMISDLKIDCPFCCNRSDILTKYNWINLARIEHGDKYDYSRAEFKTPETPMLINCPDHGPFYQKPINHVIKGRGCPICNKIKED